MSLPPDTMLAFAQNVLCSIKYMVYIMACV
jgi:hypothetical protein